MTMLDLRLCQRDATEVFQCHLVYLAKSWRVRADAMHLSLEGLERDCSGLSCCMMAKSLIVEQ